MSTVKVNTISTWTGNDVGIETGKTISGTASQFKMTDVVQGDVLYGSAADTLSRLAPGTSGEVLKTQGAGANPQWAAGGTNTPSFGAYLTANQTLVDDTWTKITMNAEEWDTNSAFDHSTNYRFTVPAGEGGKYFFTFTATGGEDDASGEDMGSIKLALYKGGVIFKQIWFDGSGARHLYRGLTLTAVLDLAATNYIEFYASMEANGSGNLVSVGGQSYTFCSGFKLL